MPILGGVQGRIQGGLLGPNAQNFRGLNFFCFLLNFGRKIAHLRT